MFSYTFIVRAFIVGTLVSVCSALLGVSLVLKRYAMIGSGLSNAGFASLALATALGAAPLAVAVPVVLAAAFLLLRLGERHILKGDAAVAIISTSSLAFGVAVVARSTGMNTDVCNFLFGSILAMNKNDVYLSVILSLSVLILFCVCYHTLFAVTFDETFARSSGINTGVYTALIALLTALTIVLGMRMMGAMLISALIIFPALTSMRLFKTFSAVSVSAVCVSLVCFFIGVVVSYLYAIPTGASVVLVNCAAFAVFSTAAAIKKQPSTAGRVVGLLAACLLCACTNPKPAPASQYSGSPASERSLQANSENQPKIKAQTVTKAEKTIEIKEKMFIAQTNDVYLNPDEYMGKTIKLEGLFKREQYMGEDHCFVLRYGPGCCGSDGNAGFEVAWDDAGLPYPHEDAWVSAQGVLKMYNEDGFPYMYIALQELTQLEKRGAEFVSQ
jgi:zinc transport system permease protein